MTAAHDDAIEMLQLQIDDARYEARQREARIAQLEADRAELRAEVSVHAQTLARLLRGLALAVPFFALGAG